MTAFLLSVAVYFGTMLNGVMKYHADKCPPISALRDDLPQWKQDIYTAQCLPKPKVEKH